jgi:penicillin amidase
MPVPGVQGRVEVIRDRWGVPHIYADSVDDLFFAQGYVTAGDRLAQMELQRRLASGRLAEVAGPAALDSDRFMRTLGLRRVAEAEWELLQKDPATHDTRYQDSARILTAYTAGVNAYIETHRDRLPLEFLLLGVSPEPWTPADSLVWGKVMALSLCANFEYELARATLIERLGAGKTGELVPAYPADAPIIVPDAVSYQGLDGAALAQARSVWQVFGGPGTGSNNWVVNGTRTASGKPLLANDPHMGIQMPALWYLVHLHGPGFDVTGGSLPGTPGVVLGHNARIAWGATNTTADVQDLYIEHLSTIGPQQYEFRGQWYDVQVITETIRVRDAAPQVLPVAYTRHGPIVSDVLPGVPPTMTLALRWASLDASATMLPAALAMDRAGNWDEFRAALRFFSAPAQNFVYADVDGNIFWMAPCDLPIRRVPSLFPLDGASGDFEWQGFVPWDELPQSENPPEHFIATANNRPVDGSYPLLHRRPL